jgi:hypothetical protein
MKNEKEWPKKLPSVLRQKSPQDLERMLNDFRKSTSIPESMKREKAQKKFLNFYSHDFPNGNILVNDSDSLAKAVLPKAKETSAKAVRPKAKKNNVKKVPDVIFTKKRKSQSQKLKKNPEFIRLSQLSSEGKPFFEQLKSVNKRRRKKGLPPIETHQLPQKKPRKISQLELKQRRKNTVYENTSASVLEIGKLSWEILPPGSSSDVATLEDRFSCAIKDAVSCASPNEIEEAKKRFKSIFKLKPVEIFRGLHSFSDYFALLFEETDKVILESIFYGNAIYIIEGNWKVLSRKTKAELKKHPNTKVISHRYDWFSKLKNYIQIGFE